MLIKMMDTRETMAMIELVSGLMDVSKTPDLVISMGDGDDGMALAW